MFVPLSDDNSLKGIRFQFVTVGLIAINAAIALTQLAPVSQGVVASFGVVPLELFSVNVFGGPAPISNDAIAIPEAYTLITYMFLHADIFHLVGNMLFLWVFGDNVEDELGHARFLVFYLLCGIGAALFHAILAPNSGIPLIGASGAVAGVIAAYLMLHPRVRVWVLVMKVIPMQVSAAVVLGIWVLTQVVMVVMPQTGPVAWWAHIGGLIVGAVLIVVLKKPGTPLFDRGLKRA